MKKKAEVWMKQVLAAFLCAAITIGGGTGTLVIAEDGNGEPTTTETTQSAETTPTGEATQPTDTETPKTGNEQAPAEGETKGRSKFIWGCLENEVKKLGESGYPMKVYPTTKPSGKTGGF